MAVTRVVKTIFQFRRATTAEWELNKSVIPAAGEPCFDLELNTLKIGNGVDTYADLEAIGGVKVDIATDGKSIVLEDSILKLAGFDAAEIGAQPRKNADGNIEWVVPSTETVDDLKTTVAGLQSDVTNMQTTVTELREIVMPSGEEGTGTLLDRVESLESKVGEVDVDAKIDAKINEFAEKVSDDKTVNTLKELVDYVAEHGDATTAIVNDIVGLKTLVGETSVEDQITDAISNSGHMTKAEAEATLLSKVEAKATFERVKYEIADAPVGTLVDYRDKEIRVMVPADAQFVKQAVGTGGDANTYYMTFKTYVPNDNVVGYREHLGNQIDDETLTDLKVDAYGRRYQPTWLGIAKYDETSGWTYYGKNSTANKYIGWDYQIDWYDANGVVVASDKIRINLSNEACHNVVEPYYMANTVKGVSVNGTLLDMIDGNVNIAVDNIVKSSNEIEVNEDGTLSIKSISFDKITQGEDEIVIMDGGNAG